MQGTMVFLIGLISFLLLPGCASRAVTLDLESDKAIVQLFGSDYSVANAEAARACNIHGKMAQQISYVCTDQYCMKKNVL